jgi:peptidoglycan hydrolase-like protein with peptidoglycan-binding domain
MKKSFLWLFLVSFGLTGVGAPAFSFAQTSTSTLQAQLDMLTSLMQQIRALQAQIQALQGQQQSAVAQLIGSFQLASQGDQVKILQALLAADESIYPEGLITGYFGNATERAVRRFQKKFGIEQVGRVGPKTLKKLNELLSQNQITSESDSDDEDHDGDRNEKRVCAIVPPGHFIAPGWLKKHDGIRPIVPECQKLPPGIDKQFPHPTSTPTTTLDMTAPSFSAIATSVMATSATITWTTNELANSQVMYGLTSSYGLSTSLDGALVTSHSVLLTGLTAGSLYHFSIRSADSSGNVATSTDSTLTTTATDTTAPIISTITASAASITATVSWTTDEAATGRVYYATSTPLVLLDASTLTQGTSALSTAHSFSLSGLASSSAYHFVVTSADAVNNVATSSELMFTTAF